LKRLLVLALCGAAAVATAGAAPAQQAALQLGGIRQLGLDRATPSGETETSTNWAGYAIRHRKPFASATGRWVQPTAACDAGTQTYSAFWVGLGGFSRTSRAVEQTGTQANCSGGTASYGAWYELYPAPPVELTLKIRPGDRMSATVTVNKKIVVIRLKNVTTGKLFSKRLHMSRPDQSSAEWVAEAPTGCDYAGNCATLPLTNFGTVAFSHGTATVKGHKGRISDPVWSATTIELHGDLDDPDHPSAAGANAIPGALGADGGSFSITWQGLPPAPAR
jgi:Peptidase A4 family